MALRARLVLPYLAFIQLGLAFPSDVTAGELAMVARVTTTAPEGGDEKCPCTGANGTACMVDDGAGACTEQTTTNFVIGSCWFLAIAMMFFAQHHVCDAYFVPAINVFVKAMKNSPSKGMQRWGEEAVAGATICALGCNGPELFTNLISLYTHSDAGIGVVVGSEIFNLLIIVGAATICAPKPADPTQPDLTLEKAPFLRDVFFYAVSIGLLFWALLDKQIQFYESCVFLGAACVYVITVYFTSDIAEKCSPTQDCNDEQVQAVGERGKMHGVEVDVEIDYHSRMADGHHEGHTSMTMDPTPRGIEAQERGGAGSSSKRSVGTGRSSMGFQLGDKGSDPLLGGDTLHYKHLNEVAVCSEGVIKLVFKKGAGPKITLKCTVSSGRIEDRDQLLHNIKEYSFGVWQHEYSAGPGEACQHFIHTLTCKKETCLSKLMAFPHVVIDVMLRSTLFFCDVKDVRKNAAGKTKERLWPVCFMGAMVWLAGFSYCMLLVANQINANIPQLPVAFLGITVCAIGTSFPNAVASIIMASQNKPAAAIANALGSNVQNVFLAMALPWMIYSATASVPFAPIPQEVAGINEGVAWMSGTLLFLCFFVALPQSFSLQKWMGYVLAFTYLIYLGLCTAESFKLMNPLLP